MQSECHRITSIAAKWLGDSWDVNGYFERTLGTCLRCQRLAGLPALPGANEWREGPGGGYRRMQGVSGDLHDNWRLRMEPKFGEWPISRIDQESLQERVNDMTESSLGLRTVRWTHSVLKMCLDHAIDSGQLIGKEPGRKDAIPADASDHPRLPHVVRGEPAG